MLCFEDPCLSLCPLSFHQCIVCCYLLHDFVFPLLISCTALLVRIFVNFITVKLHLSDLQLSFCLHQYLSFACKFGKFFYSVFFFALKVNIYLKNMRIKRRLARFYQKNVYFRCFLCAACLPASLIIHVPNSELPV